MDTSIRVPFHGRGVSASSGGGWQTIYSRRRGGGVNNGRDRGRGVKKGANRETLMNGRAWRLRGSAGPIDD